ncbi:unnamed protein product [Ectocarpus fasciculatus]
MENRWAYYNNAGFYRLQQRLRAEGQIWEPADVRLLRLMFSRHMSYGHLVGSLSCGIITGISDLWAHEGMEVVCEALENIWPDPLCRPDLLFFDLACRLRTHRLLHPDAGWLLTRYIVDRFHFRQHTEEHCALHNSPEARDDPTLWDVTPEGEETFLWNSSRAESNNSWLSGFGQSVRQMPRVLRNFFLSHAILVRNETLLNSSLLSEDANFDG